MSQARLTITQRLQLCIYKNDNRNMSQKALAAWETEEFNLTKGLTHASISKIINKRSDLEAMDSKILNAKIYCLVLHPVVKKQWFCECWSASIVELFSPGIWYAKKAEYTPNRLKIRLTTKSSLTDGYKSSSNVKNSVLSEYTGKADRLI